jgi:cyclopropane fatty-acyl-phospholipid synthase-like methyltransferase
VSTDTFEHIPEVELKKLLLDINKTLKPGGSLIYHANFSQQGLYPMHFDHSEMWDAWLVEAGFIPLSSSQAIKGK